MRWWQREKEHQHHHRKKVATQHMSIHGDDNERPQHAAAFDLANLFSALIFSSFIRFALSLSLLLLLLIFIVHRCPLDVCPFLVWRKDKKKIANVQFCYPHYSEECSIRGSYAFSYSLCNCMSLLSLKIYIPHMTLFLITHTLSISLNHEWDTYYYYYLGYIILKHVCKP